MPSFTQFPLGDSQLKVVVSIYYKHYFYLKQCSRDNGFHLCIKIKAQRFHFHSDLLKFPSSSLPTLP